MRRLAQVVLGVAVLFLAGIARADGQTQAAYQRLEAAARELAAIAAAGGWAEVPAGPALRLGDLGPRVAALRRRLAVTDGAEPSGGALFDEDLLAAVERAQQRHGIGVDGVAGRDTLAALNRSTEQRLRQVEANRARLPSLPAIGPGAQLLVNTAAFQLTLLEGGVPALTMPVIVGRPGWATPDFGSTIAELVVNPDWTVPARIARREVLARIRRDPGYLVREGFVVHESWAPGARRIDPAGVDWRTLPQGFPYKFRQLPGPSNPLGQIKFLLPNPFNVYLHDTPTKELFQRRVRALSHGCIRLADPFALAARLMQGAADWTAPRREAALASGQTETFALPRPVPIQIIYFTAWVDEGGALNLRDDIYGRDRIAEPLIAARTDPPPIGCVPAAG